MTALVITAFLVGAVLTGFGYWLGRRSIVERELERRWSDGTARLSVRDSLAADQGEVSDG